MLDFPKKKKTNKKKKRIKPGFLGSFLTLAIYFYG